MTTASATWLPMTGPTQATRDFPDIAFGYGYGSVVAAAGSSACFRGLEGQGDGRVDHTVTPAIWV